MKPFKRRVLTAAIAGLLAGSGFVQAESDLFGLDSDIRAKLAKEKAKRSSSKKSTSGNDSDQGECGSQQVGNVNTGGNRPPREVTTIITGDVINIVDRGCK
jgi:hypothetical protein